jgi:hypothetical protein
MNEITWMQKSITMPEGYIQAEEVNYGALARN